MDSMKRKDQAVAHALRNWEEYRKKSREMSKALLLADIESRPPEQRERMMKLYKEGYYDNPHLE